MAPEWVVEGASSCAAVSENSMPLGWCYAFETVELVRHLWNKEPTNELAPYTNYGLGGVGAIEETIGGASPNPGSEKTGSRLVTCRESVRYLRADFLFEPTRIKRDAYGRKGHPDGCAETDCREWLHQTALPRTNRGNRRHR